MSQLTLQLIVAEGCNLDCSYCYERHKRQRTMPFEVAKSALDHYFNFDETHHEIMIDFMGGEPTLAFPLIKRIVDYVCKMKNPKPFHFCMSTNGTLFNDDSKSWMAKRRRFFTPMLSFDGTKCAQNTNRCNTYDYVSQHLDFFRANWPTQSLQMTVNSMSLPHLADGVLSIFALGFPAEFSLVYEDVWGTGDVKKTNMRIFEHELARLVDFFSEHVSLPLPHRLNLPLHKLVEPDLDPHQSNCGAGTHMATIGIDGRRYPCHRFLEISAGRSMTLDEYHNPEVNKKVGSDCDACPCIHVCPTCQAYNWERHGSITSRTNYKCELNKLEMVATAAITVNRIRALYRDISPTKLPDEWSDKLKNKLKGAQLALRFTADATQAELTPYVTEDWLEGAERDSRLRWHERRIPVHPS